MSQTKVFLVHLRRPDLSNKDEQRDDPFYEKGSFGCTGCHGSNLLHPRNSEALLGARLAFAQGGPLGTRLVFLTPPITVIQWRNHCEVRWTPISMPFKYQDAPLLVSNDGDSDFPHVMQIIEGTNRRSLEGAFSSRFRTRTQELPKNVATQLTKAYQRVRSKCPPSAIAETYDKALPYPPPKPDRNRDMTYQAFIDELELTTSAEVDACGSSRRRKTERRRARC